ncbi:unnamed protein product [Rotaria sp. Silwood2]|nr:unnamed protein product [Rotaria sp. Silwood2]CAF2526901.1 unnamed protein product [Rotaria sp. Silwood2]CAF2758063.1 unnamed protein product [Rotaria sp. Silwood2]CAF2936349.1 unnamed protein product [Rotaria sp. Silwood2]CAF4027867.1 unnamed protein product [Rotaria sp. Silwood2]
MKISDSTTTTTSTLLMSSPLLLKKNKPTKPFKFNRRLKNRMSTLSKGSASISIPINNYQIIPVSSIWKNTQVTSPNPVVTLINTNSKPINTYLPSAITPSSINQQQQNTPVYPSFKSFTTPRVTTTLIPLNVCPTEYCQTVKSTPIPSINIIKNNQEHNMFENKSKGSITTHLIGDWIIRESSEPFQRKENERSTPIEQIDNQEKKLISNESVTSHSSSSGNVNQWTIDDVCSFFENVLGKNCYASIIKEHLIDGAALVLLEDEHLSSVFKMQLGPRLKLLNSINKLKNGDLSVL